MMEMIPTYGRKSKNKFEIDKVHVLPNKDRCLLTLVFFFNKVTNDLVIEIRYGFPSNTLTAIFVLFRFQCQLDKELLKLLVTIINAKLLKAV